MKDRCWQGVNYVKACDPQCVKDAGENVRTMLANILCKSKERGYCVYLLMNKYSQKFSQFKQFEDFKIDTKQSWHVFFFKKQYSVKKIRWSRPFLDWIVLLYKENSVWNIGNTQIFNVRNNDIFFTN